jgi:hypothetical protein
VGTALKKKRTIKKKVAADAPPISVVNVETVPIRSIKPYRQNPRVGNIEKVMESLRANGQFKAICVNIGTNASVQREILGGNHTWLGMRKLGWEECLVAWVDVDDEQAKRIVLADNGASDGSTYDDQILADLLGSMSSLVGTTYDNDVLERLVVKVKEEEDPNVHVDKIEDASEELGGVTMFKDNLYFESDLPYGMPELLLDMIPEEVPEPLDVWAGHELDSDRADDPDINWLAVWHTGCRGIPWKQAIACFYTEDFHFEACYTKPSAATAKLLNLGVKTAMMPNYSHNPDWPIATKIWASYRSFFVARFFQEAGIMVIPDLQYGNGEESLDISLVGIPDGCPVVSAQIQNVRKDKNLVRQVARLLKTAEDRVGFENIIVYGHKDADDVLEKAGLRANIVRVDNRTSRRRAYLNDTTRSLSG